MWIIFVYFELYTGFEHQFEIPETCMSFMIDHDFWVVKSFNDFILRYNLWIFDFLFILKIFIFLTFFFPWNTRSLWPSFFLIMTQNTYFVVYHILRNRYGLTGDILWVGARHRGSYQNIMGLNQSLHKIKSIQGLFWTLIDRNLSTCLSIFKNTKFLLKCIK